MRTVLRWEKERGLPVHRIPGATGRVVFAYVDELDAWSHGESKAAAAAPPHNLREPLPAEAAPITAAPEGGQWWIMGAIAVVLLAAVGWRAPAWNRSEPITVDVRTDGIVALDADGIIRWRHAFARRERAYAIAGPATQMREATGDREATFLAATSTEDVLGAVRGGQLYEFAPTGELRGTFRFDDSLTFGTSRYGPPWALSTFRVSAGDPEHRVAVAAHHHEWWPSMVTILDQRGNRGDTFVNAGWIEGIAWALPDRLVISGFNNPADGGMIALLDVRALGGQSPPVAPAAFNCTSCESGLPLRYIVLPRSEVNLASFSPFNRTVLEERPEGFLARTQETSSVAGQQGVADALYEFTRDLHLVGATYGDRYWEIHRQLESNGRLTHSRNRCPDRHGPPVIHVWEPRTGWTTQPVVRR